ncbi:MAG: 5-amino-6-(5-phospho-D-ribitylamino)uracil phosphatase YwtE [Gammaproteobacteria bacterium]|nr:MAG: 5-amino-6-(5-phospho-D-ribitylamino)uracil phosphatase YwtE [Gammaproteobacteria bacterium]
MAMVVTDLDGTLLDAQARLGSANRRALERLGETGSLRVVATGRSLHSAEQVLDAAFPIDYLVFSSGAGILEWRGRELLAAHEMRSEHARGALDLLLSKGLAFMVHLGIPDNHHFYFHRPPGRVAGENPDFDRRCQRYADFAQPLDGRDVEGLRVSQFLAIEAPGRESLYDALVTELDHLNVVLTTSPLDHRSRWIEIFPPAVSKSQAAEWLRARHGVAHHDVVAVGNDYNDRDLLEWARYSYVVANAAPSLKARYAVVASNDDQGFAEAMAARGLL